MNFSTSLRLVSQKLPCHCFQSLTSVRTSVSLAEDPRRANVEQRVKKFHEIPGPNSLPWIGTSYLYLFGVYSAKRHRAAFQKYLKYGPIVREEIKPGNFVVSIFHHNDMEHLFLSENNVPQAQSHLPIIELQKNHPNALLPVNGEDWLKLRKEFQDFSSPQLQSAYLPVADKAIKDFVTFRTSQNIDDFLPELLRLSLQLTLLAAFDKKIDCFSSKEMKPDSLSSHVMEAVLTSNRLLCLFDKLPSNPKDVPSLWKKFEKAMLLIEKVSVELVQEKAKSLYQRNMKKSESAVPSLIEFLLTSSNLNYKDAVRISVNLLLAGVENTAYTASFALYHLAKNERVQNMLRLESQRILMSPTDPITDKTLEDASYARAVLKEVFRMNPLLPGYGRTATQDIVLSGYHIPKGTTIVTENQTACRLQKHFVRPNDFIPERWIKGSPVQVKDNPFLVLPFGFGSRSCVARHLAEQQLLLLLLRVVSSCVVSWTSEEILDCKNLNSTINQPDKDLKFTFNRIF
ncbi:cytochrome P450 302a1, mitochondrial-like [Thrips palmi]|uniref:Cytochrome P450 302a1, mitochondrial-like n=1 Tax=Thrips palmi TaxID=161013 RepID=A0A6P8Y0E8_THRPL|nr:cytochrome P450 302a1, mitochondrial-like [Thrips palmi]XP_034232933.1 cytochrome P450 302a1, mitochondrial-like [Thrips palmi]